MKRWVLLFLLIAAVTAVSKTKEFLPDQGVIPDEATAVKVAEAIFLPVFGQAEIDKFRPYHAQLRDGVWTIYGTLPPSSRGGTPQLTIQKRDGKVLEIWHSQ